MKHIINLAVGDYYADGHGQWSQIIVGSNLDKTQLQTAYFYGKEKVGFDFLKIDYREGGLTIPQLQRLLELGLDDNMLESLYKADDEYYPVNRDEIPLIYMFICSLGNSALIWWEEEVENLYLGAGYGLFGH